MPRAAVAADPVGQVDAVRGRATGLLEGALRELGPGLDVFLTEVVETEAEARLALALGETTLVRLGERTRLRIEQAIVEQGGEILLERGALLFDSGNDAKQGEPEVRTPFAVIAARGTRFFVGPSNNVIGVFVEVGVVNVRNRAGDVTLRAGQGTNLVSFDVAPTPAAEWGAPRIAAALASVT